MKEVGGGNQESTSDKYPVSSDFPPLSLLLGVIFPVTSGVRSVG